MQRTCFRVSSSSGGGKLLASFLHHKVMALIRAIVVDDPGMNASDYDSTVHRGRGEISKSVDCSYEENKLERETDPKSVPLEVAIK